MQALIIEFLLNIILIMRKYILALLMVAIIPVSVDTL